MDNITWHDFEKVELRAGTIVDIEDFPEAKKPAYKLKIDFGNEIGLRKSSAQITSCYSKADLIGKQVIAVVNFSPKQIGKFMSECLVTGFSDGNGNIVISTTERKVPDGAKLM